MSEYKVLISKDEQAEYVVEVRDGVTTVLGIVNDSIENYVHAGTTIDSSNYLTKATLEKINEVGTDGGISPLIALVTERDQYYVIYRGFVKTNITTHIEAVRFIMNTVRL